MFDTLRRVFSSWVRRRPYAAALAINAVVWVLFYAWAAPIYLTNDDAGIYFMVSGALKDWPASPYPLFPHYVMGRVWHQLYAHWPSIPWYGLSLVGGLYVAFSMLAGLLMRKRGPWGVLLYAVLLGTAGIWAMMYLQFTIVSALLMVGGLYLWAFEQKASLRAVGWLLMIWGFLLRPYSVMIAAAVGAALLWRWLVRRRWRDASRRMMTRRATDILMMGIGAVGLSMINAAAYQRHPAWRECIEYNARRAAIQDYRIDSRGKSPDEKAAFLERIGWTANDLALFRAHLYLHPVFLGAHLQRLSIRRELRDKLTRELAITTALETLNVRAHPIIGHGALWLCCLLLWLIRRRTEALEALGWLALLVLVVWLGTWLLKFPGRRAVFPLVFSTGFLVLYYDGGNGKPLRTILQYMGLAGIVLIIGWQVRWLREATLTHRHRTAHLREALRRMQRKNHIYVLHPVFPTNYTPPLRESFPWDSLDIIPIGGMMQTPTARALMKRKSLPPDLYRALLDPSVVLVAIDSTLIRRIETFYAEHYGWRVRGRIVDSVFFPEPWWRFYMWKFEKE